MLGPQFFIKDSSSVSDSTCTLGSIPRRFLSILHASLCTDQCAFWHFLEQ